MIDGLTRPLGRGVLDAGRYAIALYWHFVRAVVSGLARGEGELVVRRTALYQVYFTGVEAIPVVAALALILGALIIVQALTLLSGTGAEDFLGTVIELVVFRELGPIMTALIVIGRSGSSITVELGNMAVFRELDLLESMGIDRMRFLVMPRMLGVTAATVCLGLLFDVVAVLGGFAVARLQISTPLFTFLEIVGRHITVVDVLAAVLKTLLFGLVIATVSTWHGLAVGRAVTEVPQATRRSVVHSLVLVVAFDAVITAALYAGGL